MRLDIFLKLSRLSPRRSTAQKLCDAGFVFLNGRAAKSAHAVKSGDTISIRTPVSETRARILTVPSAANVSRKQAKDLIEMIEHTTQSSLTG
jgi:ribosomal 50S subunit-recycling heat shock protein